jgi:hypothetical protein
MLKTTQHLKNGAAKRCTVCRGKFGLIRYYTWRIAVCSKKCSERFHARKEDDRRWLGLPTDPQIAHIAYTAGVIDIAAAEQAQNNRHKEVKAFAEDMVRDHEAVNKQALDLVKKQDLVEERWSRRSGISAICKIECHHFLVPSTEVTVFFGGIVMSQSPCRAGLGKGRRHHRMDQQGHLCPYRRMRHPFKSRWRTS